MAKFCIKCGNKLGDNVKFCTKCGYKVESNNVPENKPKIEPVDTQSTERKNATVINPTPVIGNKEQCSEQTTASSMSFFKKINPLYIGGGVGGLLVVAGLIYGFVINTPARAVENYLGAISKGQYEDAFSYLAINEKYNTEKGYVSSMQYLVKENKLIPFSLPELVRRKDAKVTIEETKDLEKDKLPPENIAGKKYTSGYSVKFSMPIKEGSKNVTRTLRVVEGESRKLLLFKNYKVYDDSLVARLNFSVSSNSKLSVDGKNIDFEKKKDNSNQSNIERTPLIPVFFGKHEIKVEHPLCNDYKTELVLLPQNGLVQGTNYDGVLLIKNELVASAQKEAETFVKNIIDAASKGAGLSSIGYTPKNKWDSVDTLYKSLVKTLENTDELEFIGATMKEKDYIPKFSGTGRVSCDMHYKFSLKPRDGIYAGKKIVYDLDIDSSYKLEGANKPVFSYMNARKISGTIED